MDDTVVAIYDVSERAWLQAADVIVGQHRTRWAARRWIDSVRQCYPGCVVAVTRQRRDRWCVVGLPARVFLVRGGYMDAAMSIQIGRAAYQVWAAQGVRS
ncbi:hypothetical protein CLV71_102522 [Actinophytocola oryzae]|uniref:Uncharacterized protein n=2 Tax=Actinophytocola oryzae TaxID=502181 RepID=A0A4R7W2T5_9PSEU|nr:hypothetical protein CLV71_102522 [Actinophytocola oryzae]